MVLPVVLNSPYKLEPLQVAAGVTLKVLTVELFWTEISIVGLLPWETGPAGALMKMVEPMAKPGGSAPIYRTTATNNRFVRCSISTPKSA